MQPAPSGEAIRVSFRDDEDEIEGQARRHAKQNLSAFRIRPHERHDPAGGPLNVHRVLGTVEVVPKLLWRRPPAPARPVLQARAGLPRHMAPARRDLNDVVEARGFEPPTSAVRVPRSPS